MRLQQDRLRLGLLNTHQPINAESLRAEGCVLFNDGKFKLKWKTAKKKFRVKLRELKGWFRTSLTAPANEVWSTLNAKLRGHC